ncbi:MAG: tRNA preQ1(34) S-adenosylmethionine ribosyltransferase-isomerase QueA [Spirochaetia bacterium]|nr:tRNA preQ1(34) S-adenosylmethionine ribosyltransferase-isomerase QueA [Spirochaetia bacterium]
MKNEKIIELLKSFQFDLPEELIAKYPSQHRGDSRLLIVHKDGRLEDSSIQKLPDYLPEDSLIVKNNTRVSKRRVYLNRKSGGKIESLFLNHKSENLWECLIRGSGRLKNKETLNHPSGFQFQYTEKEGHASGLLKISDADGKPALASLEDSEIFFEAYGEMPIPPYLKRNAEEIDTDRYQTVYAFNPGSIAAPTAGLHLTEDLIADLKRKSIPFYDLELRIGYGTFAPLQQENFTENKLHEEIYSIPEITSEILNHNKDKIIAVGTTTLRALESNFREFGSFQSGHYATSLFIYPPDTVQTTNGLLTNFHLPESSLFLLVCAYRPDGIIQNAYRHAVKEKYRFFSYGDAMLILR